MGRSIRNDLQDDTKAINCAASEGRLIIEHVIVAAVRTSRNDSAASLARQLGLTGKAAAAFIPTYGLSTNDKMRMTICHEGDTRLFSQ